MKFYLFGKIQETTVNGLGLRYTVFFQGCPFHCDGCHNIESHELNKNIANTDDIIKEFKLNPLLSGITFSGGEPFLQPLAGIAISKEIKKLKKNIWCYTGYTYEELTTIIKEKKQIGYNDIELFLNYIDVLVDGRFIKELKNEKLKFRGSSNQRIIDMNATRKKNKVIELDL